MVSSIAPITKAGTSYRLTASATGLTGVNSAMFDVGKADQTVTFGSLANRQYGSPPVGLSASASSGLPITFSTTGNCTVSGALLTLTGAGSCVVRASQAGDANYNAAPLQSEGSKLSYHGDCVRAITRSDTAAQLQLGRVSALYS